MKPLLGPFLLGATIAALAALAAPVAARTVEERLIAGLKSQGYVIVENGYTFLGRLRIVAQSDKYHREIVVNPGTGEVLRDYAVERPDAPDNDPVAAPPDPVVPDPVVPDPVVPDPVVPDPVTVPADPAAGAADTDTANGGAATEDSTATDPDTTADPEPDIVPSEPAVPVEPAEPAEPEPPAEPAAP